jgi:hypothetical protein
MSDLESVPGTALSCNVFSPRLRRPNAVELSMDMGYCGRATGIFRAVGMGAQGRFSQHQRYIRHASLSRRKKVDFSEQSSSEEGDTEKGLWVHERLAHEDIDHISYTLLSVLEVIDLSNPQLIQYHMCPAETVDVILLGTMNLKTGNRRLELGFRLRPQNMPSRDFVGLNCALPAFQPMNLHGVRHFSGWMSSEIDALVSLMRNNEDSVFAFAGSSSSKRYERRARKNHSWRSRVSSISSRGIPDQVCSLGSRIDSSSTGR